MCLKVQIVRPLAHVLYAVIALSELICKISTHPLQVSVVVGNPIWWASDLCLGESLAIPRDLDCPNYSYLPN